MTTDWIDTTVPGFKLDVAVAEACGFGDVFVCDYFWWPSRDWSIAMEATQKFGLFHDFDAKIAQMGENWVVLSYDPHCKHDVILAKHTLGPVAICRAILKANQLKSA